MDISIILKHLEHSDPTLATAGRMLGAELRLLTKQSPQNYLSDLCKSIVSQQLSVKAASTIWGRTHSVVLDWNNPQSILAPSIDELKAVGLSGQKAQYVKNIAESVLNKELHLTNLDNMSDKEVVEALVRIKGIGKWTAEMFLIFSLGRSDVFSSGDLGLRNGIKKLYDLSSVSTIEAESLAIKWSPYRSTACLILWGILDNKPSH